MAISRNSYSSDRGYAVAIADKATCSRGPSPLRTAARGLHHHEVVEGVLTHLGNGGEPAIQQLCKLLKELSSQKEKRVAKIRVEFSGEKIRLNPSNDGKVPAHTRT